MAPSARRVASEQGGELGGELADEQGCGGDGDGDGQGQDGGQGSGEQGTLAASSTLACLTRTRLISSTRDCIGGLVNECLAFWARSQPSSHKVLQSCTCSCMVQSARQAPDDRQHTAHWTLGGVHPELRVQKRHVVLCRWYKEGAQQAQHHPVDRPLPILPLSRASAYIHGLRDPYLRPTTASPPPAGRQLRKGQGPSTATRHRSYEPGAAGWPQLQAMQADTRPIMNPAADEWL